MKAWRAQVVKSGGPLPEEPGLVSMTRGDVKEGTIQQEEGWPGGVGVGVAKRGRRHPGDETG